MSIVNRVRVFPHRMFSTIENTFSVPSYTPASERSSSRSRRKSNGSVMFRAKDNWSQKQYERWEEYPNESDTLHHGHHRCATQAPRVNYCYDCGKHYRPETDMRQH